MKDLTIILVIQHGMKGIKETISKLKQEHQLKNPMIFVENCEVEYTLEDVTLTSSQVQIVKYEGKPLGVALNKAMDLVSTKYVMFMEDYDYLDHKFMADCVKALESDSTIHIATGKSYCISPLLQKTPRQHYFSSAFINEDRIVDLAVEPQTLLTNLGGSIFVSDFVRSTRFNETLEIETNVEFMMRACIQDMRFAAVPTAKYYYFEPRENQNPYHVLAHDERWYEYSLTNYVLPLLDYAEKTCGKIPEFVQIYIMYYVNCRMMENKDNRNKKLLLDEKLDSYLNVLQQVFMRIDDFILLNQYKFKFITQNPEMRCMYLRIKYGKDQVTYNYRPELMLSRQEDLVMCFKDHVISNLSSHRFVINVMNYVNGKLWIDGSLISIFQYGNVEYYAKFNGKRYEVKDTDAYSFTKYFGVPGYRRLTYHLELPIDVNNDKQRIEFFARMNGKEYQMMISFGNHWAKLSKSPRYSYWHFNKYICHHGNNGIVIKKATLRRLLTREFQFQMNLIKNHHKKDFKALGFRWLYWITYPYFKNKKIWLMLDKLYKGGDSSEYLYRYSANFDDGITKYYLINRDVSDYKKLVKDGYKPLVPGTLMHKLVFVHADIILITNSHLFPFNGYNKGTSKYIRGLCNFSSMCLQHGLSVQKCAMAQRRIIDNTMMYFIASKYEHQNLSKHAYGYDGFDILKTTGIARYDGLINNDQRQILISPTWRMYNALPVTTSEGEQRGYNPEFKHTVYFQVYNNLINNERLLENAKKYGYKIKFLLHPIISSQLDDFTKNSELEVIPSVGDLSYEEILTKSSLMVTDYSGVQFDFAYMRKPIVYFHPEELPPHYEDGIFFYDTMGFGEICTKSEQLIDMLIDYMANNCEMKEKYRLRADDFFTYKDHNNCERIYNEIMKYQEQVDKDKLRK